MVPLSADDSRLLKDVSLFVEPIEVYDSNGKLLGIFVPANMERCKEISAKAAAQMDRAEIKRRLATERPAGLFSDLVKRLQVLNEESKRRRAAGEQDFTFEEARAHLSGETGEQPAGPGS
jgi:hypothetical protein